MEKSIDKSIRLFTISLIAAFTLEAADGRGVAKAQRPNGRRLVWHDEFNGTALDLTK